MSEIQKIMLLFILLFATSVAVLVGDYYDEKAERLGEQACTQEAKICPDGSAVGRTGPNCEFAECLGDADTTVDISNWQTYRNEEYGFEFRYPSTQLDIAEEHNSIGEVRHIVINHLAPGGNFGGIVVYDGSIESVIESAINGRLGIVRPELRNAIATKDIIDNKPAKILTTRHEGFYGEEFAKIVFIQHEGSKVIGIWGPVFTEEYKEIGELFNQILSTFKFIEQ